MGYGSTLVTVYSEIFSMSVEVFNIFHLDSLATFFKLWVTSLSGGRSLPLTSKTTLKKKKNPSVLYFIVKVFKKRSNPQGDISLCWLLHSSGLMVFSEVLFLFSDELSNQICYIRPDGFNGLLWPPKFHDLTLRVD